MGFSFFGHDSKQEEHYNAVQEGDYHEKKHDPSFVHELIAGAASFEAAKAYEDHVAKNGKPESHAKAKEILAGFAGAFVDREVESKGLDFLDKEKAKHAANKHAHEAYDERDHEAYDERDHDRYDQRDERYEEREQRGDRYEQREDHHGEREHHGEHRGERREQSYGQEYEQRESDQGYGQRY